MEIEYIGLKAFTVIEADTIRSISENYFNKILREFNQGKILVNVKKFVKAGLRSKYSVHLRVDHPSLVLNATDSDWELARALHKCFTNMRNEVKKRFPKEKAKQKSFKV
ncbi:hypothetical protein HZB88_02435 [archaeon]|nr:hypothetical protein [archaeon]